MSDLLEEFLQLRYDDPYFAEQYDDSDYDFEQWLKDFEVNYE